MKKDWVYNGVVNEITGIDTGNCRVIVATPYGKDIKERDKHGRLIAAAPELLKACEEAFSYACDNKVLPNIIMNEFSQLITKVEGR